MSSATPPPAEAAELLGRRAGKPGLTLLAALLGLFITLLDITVVTVALPTIGTDLQASFRGLEWVANAYMLALAVFIVTAGRLGDLYGQRRVYTLGTIVFLLGSLICALSGRLSILGWAHITTLHLGRVVQGLGGAVVLPLTLAIVYSCFEGRKRALGIMLWGAVGGLATALGPLVGGLLVEWIGWEWIFLVNLPIGAVVIVAALVGLRDPAPRAVGRSGESLDLPGLVIVSAALFCLNLGLINGAAWGWSSWRVLGLLGGSIALFALFLFAESRATDPIMDLSWFRRQNFGGSVLAGFLMGAGMFSVLFYLSIYLQNGLGLSALATGVRLLPLTLVLMLGAPLGGRVAAKLGVRKALAGAFVLMAIGIALFTLVDPEGGADSWTLLLPGMLITGFTMGVVMPISSELTVAAAPPEQIGVGASAGTMFRQVGNAVGIAVMGAMMSSQTDAVRDKAARLKEAGTLTAEKAEALQRAAVTHGLQHGAWYAAGLTLAAALFVLLLVRDPRSPASPTAPAEQTAPVLSVHDRPTV
ncbi:MFS transporter [Kitasatospora sp. NPDC056181]|uniref:MFS transporter n=1 Tax=Kitasatospora sp. NPDC056181 TaxID=3345737 RepID=UPI0035E01CAF